MRPILAHNYVCRCILPLPIPWLFSYSSPITLEFNIVFCLVYYSTIITYSSSPIPFKFISALFTNQSFLIHRDFSPNEVNRSASLILCHRYFSRTCSEGIDSVFSWSRIHIDTMHNYVSFYPITLYNFSKCF